MHINHEDSRFELEQDGHLAYADFMQDGKSLVIRYVYAPPALRGTGAAGKLMQDIKDYAEDGGLGITPLCSYAATWLSRNG